MKTTRRVAAGPWPRLQRFWDLRAACNFIGGGTGSGLLMAAAVFALLDRPYAVLLIAGLGCVAFGLAMVWLEIGKPWRALNVFLHPQTSWMTREGVVAIPLFALGAAAYVMQGSVYGTTAAVVTGLLAAGFLYCQARILRAAKGIPAWRHPALTRYLLVSGPVEGGGLALAITGSTDPFVLAGFAGLVTLRAALWGRYTLRLRRDGAPAETRALIGRVLYPVSIAGHALPLALTAVAAGGQGGAVLVAAAGSVAGFAGWWTKWLIITRAAQTRGFAIPRTPVRGRGMSREASRPGW